MSGMTAGRIVRPCLPHSVMPDVSPLWPSRPLPLCYFRSPLLVFPLFPSVIPAKAGIQCLSSVPFIRAALSGKNPWIPDYKCRE